MNSRALIAFYTLSNVYRIPAFKACFSPLIYGLFFVNARAIDDHDEIETGREGEREPEKGHIARTKAETLVFVLRGAAITPFPSHFARVPANQSDVAAGGPSVSGSSTFETFYAPITRDALEMRAPLESRAPGTPRFNRRAPGHYLH